MLYDGQYLDQATGFYYLRARWYDPESDEFLAVDPDLAQTGEPFSYAGDDPVNEGDPSGDLACSGSDAVPPWTPGLVQMANAGNENCAQQMAVNWVWHNTLQGVLMPTAVLNRKDQTELAEQITASSISATIAIWFTYPGECSPGGDRVTCSDQYSNWMTDGIGSGYLDMDPAAWYSWKTQVFAYQFMSDWTATIVESLISSATGGIDSWLGQKVANEVLSELFADAPVGPSTPITASGGRNANLEVATNAGSENGSPRAEVAAGAERSTGTLGQLLSKVKGVSSCSG